MTPTTLDPQNQQETAVANVTINIFDTLLERDERLRLVPLLAETYRAVSPTAWDFTLRRGVGFHNGEPFNAESVKFTFERLVNPSLRLRQAASYAPLSHVQIVDDYRVRIHTSRPWPLLPNMMATAAMLPPDHYRALDLARAARDPIGTGPFRFVRSDVAEGIVLESNDRYWRGKPAIESVIFRAIGNDDARVRALESDEIDLAVNIPANLAVTLGSNRRVIVSTVPSVRTIQLIHYTHEFDSEHRLIGPVHSPLADRNVRMAIACAVDAAALIARILDGHGRRIATMLTPNHFGFDRSLQPRPRDVERARTLLAKAGYSDGFDLVLNAPRGRYMRDVDVANAVAEMLRDVGIAVTVRCHEWSFYLNQLAYRHQAGPMWLFGWGTSHYDAETMYVPLFRSGKPLSNHHNPRLDSLLDEAQAIIDGPKRQAAYRTVNHEWLAEAPAVPLYQQTDIYGISRRLQWAARGDERLKAYDMEAVG